MALGDRLLKKVASMSTNRRPNDGEDAAQSFQQCDQASSVRSPMSNASVLSSSSANGFASSTTASQAGSGRGDAHGHRSELSHQAMFRAHQHHAVQNPNHHPHHHPARPESKTSVAMSIASGSSSGSASGRVGPKVIMKGYLLVKKGMLKGYEKRFYFLHARSADLYCFKDEIAFDEWQAADKPLVKRPLDKGNSVTFPNFVCTVLRADRAGDASAFDRAIAVIAGDHSKFQSIKFLTPSANDCETWIKAFHHVQLTRRARSGSNSTSTTGSVMDTSLSATQVADDDSTPMHTPSSVQSFEALLHQHVHRSYTTMPQNEQRQGGETPSSGRHARRMSDTSETVSQHSENSSHPHQSSMAASSASTKGMLLFVPAAGSAISLSDNKLAHAKKEMEELVARGAKPPLRGGMENAKSTTWRYGTPQYILDDLEYVKGKTRDQDTTPLESYTENCCQTFVMEATHKAHYHEWTSVRHEYFYIQVNDGDRVVGKNIKENDLFGMLYLNDIQVDMDLREGEEKKHPRAVLAEAFTQGFPMEVLDVYTQPPECHFAWRHWGRFTGRYKGVRGNGELIELRGFGQTHIDAGRLLNLRIFFKQRDLFDQLNRAVAPAIAAQPARPQSQRQTSFPPSKEPAAAAVAPVAETVPVSAPVAQASAAPVPPPAAPVAAAPSTPQLKPVRSDKLSDDLIGDFTNLNIVAPPRKEQPSDRDAASSQQAPVNRSQIYQRFMPQASSA